MSDLSPRELLHERAQRKLMVTTAQVCCSSLLFSLSLCVCVLGSSHFAYPQCRFGHNSKSLWSLRPKLGVQSRLVPVWNTVAPCLWGESETTIVKLPYL